MAMMRKNYLVVCLTEDGAHYTWWEVDAPPPPNIPVQANANNTTSSSTLGTAIQNAMPSLATTSS